MSTVCQKFVKSVLKIKCWKWYVETTYVYVKVSVKPACCHRWPMTASVAVGFGQSSRSILALAFPTTSRCPLIAIAKPSPSVILFLFHHWPPAHLLLLLTMTAASSLASSFPTTSPACCCVWCVVCVGQCIATLDMNDDASWWHRQVVAGAAPDSIASNRHHHRGSAVAGN